MTARGFAESHYHIALPSLVPDKASANLFVAGIERRHLAKQGLCASLPARPAHCIPLHPWPRCEVKGEPGAKGRCWAQPWYKHRLFPDGPRCGPRCCAQHGRSTSGNHPWRVLGRSSLCFIFVRQLGADKEQRLVGDAVAHPSWEHCCSPLHMQPWGAAPEMG